MNWHKKSLLWFKNQSEACRQKRKLPRYQGRKICYFKTENSDMMLKMIQPLLWLLERYCHPYYVVYTNFPGEIVYEDDYQIVVKVDENIVIEDVQDSWSPEE